MSMSDNDHLGAALRDLPYPPASNEFWQRFGASAAGASISDVDSGIDDSGIEDSGIDDRILIEEEIPMSPVPLTSARGWRKRLSFVAAAASLLLIVGAAVFLGRDGATPSTSAANRGDTSPVESDTSLVEGLEDGDVDGRPGDEGEVSQAGDDGDEALEQEFGTAQFLVDGGADVVYLIESCVIDDGTVSASLGTETSGIAVAGDGITTTGPVDSGTASATIAGGVVTVSGTLQQQGGYVLTIYGCDPGPDPVQE